MANEVALFGGEGLPAYLRNAGVDEMTKNLMGSTGGKRISIKGNVFRMIVGGKEIAISEERSMDVVVINAAPKIHRTFYMGTYVEGESARPDCWSTDGDKPDERVKKPQSSACATCPQNVKGSGQGDTRACRFNQKLAIALANDLEGHVYALNLPSQSIFASEDNKKMGLQQYAKFIAGHGVPIGAVVTKMKFDLQSPTPKLSFSPVRALSEAEYNAVQAQAKTQEAIDAITLHVADLDGAPEKSKEPSPKRVVQQEPEEPVVKSKAKPVVVEDDEEEEEAPPVVKKAKRVVAEDVEVAEPKVRTKPATPTVEQKDVKSILAQWADDDDD